jgi:hypothetical protein
MHENKTFFFDVLTKTGFFNSGFVSLRYKNTNQYYAIVIKIGGKSTNFH